MDPNKIDHVVERMGNIPSGAPLAYALDLGELVTAELLNGQVEGWRTSGPLCAALRRLAIDPRLPVSESSLYRAVHVHEVRVRRGHVDVRLSLGHLRAVSGLPGPLQDRLLEESIRDNLRAREVETLARFHRRRIHGSRGSPVLGTLRRLATRLDRLDPAIPGHRVELRKVLARIRQRVSQLERDLGEPT